MREGWRKSLEQGSRYRHDGLDTRLAISGVYLLIDGWLNLPTEIQSVAIIIFAK
jgi:hypothetical protein